MLRQLNSFIFLILVIGAIGHLGCLRDNVLYKNFQSVNAPIKVSMAYPDGWGFNEDKGKDYWQVVFYEPRKKNVVFNPAIVVTFYSRPDTPSKAKEQLIRNRMKFDEFEVLNMGRRKVNAFLAEQIVFTYKTVGRLYIYDPKPVLPIKVKEKVLLFRAGEWLVSARYENVFKDFSRFEGVFSYLLTTLKIGS